MDLGEDELRVGGLTLRGVTRGGIQTCLMCPELGLMFDAGGRVPGQLRYDTILISHGHQDHLGGLPTLISQRKLAGLSAATVHVPVEIFDPLGAIFAAWAKIEDFELEVDLKAYEPEQRVEFGKGVHGLPIRSVHRVPSLCWLVERTTSKLLPQYVGLTSDEIRQLRHNDVTITESTTAGLLCVTGDTQIELFVRDERVRRARVLVHEVTAWDDRRTVEEIRGWGHTHVDELIPLVEQFEGEALVLVHRSPRHTRAEAEQVVQQRFPAAVRDKVHVFGH